MRNGSWGACGTSTAQFIIHVIHTKASCSEQTQKISISPPSLFFPSRFESLFFINPLYVTSSLLMVLSSYHLTGKLIPVFDCCQPQHNDPYPSPKVLLTLPFPWIGCQDKVIIKLLVWVSVLACLAIHLHLHVNKSANWANVVFRETWSEVRPANSHCRHLTIGGSKCGRLNSWLNSVNTLMIFSVAETEVLHFCCISELQFYTENKEISG